MPVQGAISQSEKDCRDELMVLPRRWIQAGRVGALSAVNKASAGYENKIHEKSVLVLCRGVSDGAWCEQLYGAVRCGLDCG